MKREHWLKFAVAVPAKTTEDKVHTILAQARAFFRDLAAPYARDMIFKHKVSDREAQLGGPKGKKVKVIYIELLAGFDGLLNDQTANLKRAVDMKHLKKLAEEAKAIARGSKP